MSNNSVKSVVWNVNSWTTVKECARIVCLTSLEADIILLTETKLLENDEIEVNNFTWLGQNRKTIKKQQKSGSGGVGILIRNSILNFFHVVCVDTTFEGIFVIKLVNKETQYEIAIGVLLSAQGLVL